MKRKLILGASIIMALAAILAGCQSSESSSTYENTNTYTSEAATSGSADSNADDDLGEIEVKYTDKDNESSYDENSATNISLSDTVINIEGSGATYKDNVVNISAAGTYVFSGQLSNGQIVVETTKVDTVQLILDNVTLTNETGSALYIKQAEKVIVTLADGSTNYISDSKNYDDTSDDAPDAAIYAGDDLSFNGSGSLTVEGNYKHAIKTVDQLVITDGTYSISAVSDGLRGKDSVSISGGSIEISAGSDAIKSDNSEDSNLGWVSIDGGTIQIAAGNSGIQGNTGLLISDGDISIMANQDTLHSNGSIRISGGDITLAAGDDGVHADNSLDVTGGNITVTQSYEGLEGSEITISGGNINVNASDDGLNAAGGSDGDMQPQDHFRDSGNYFIAISGGSIYVNTGGDGIDSNGSIAISGGYIVVDGPTSGANSAIDIENSTFTVTGGTIIAAGSLQMLVNPTDASQPVFTIIYNQNQNGGSIVGLYDSDGNEILTASPEKTYQCLMLSSPLLEKGGEYTIVYDNNSQVEFTISDMIMNIGPDGSVTQYSGGFGGGGGGFDRGGKTKPGGGMPGHP